MGGGAVSAPQSTDAKAGFTPAAASGAWGAGPLTAPQLTNEAVADTDHGLDVVARGTELRAQAPHVGVDAARVHLGVLAPHPVEQAFPGEHASGALHHVAHELELLVGEPDLL